MKTGVKDTLFCQKKTLNIRGKLIRIDAPMIMGILNITPDSFYEGSRFTSSESILNAAGKMIDEGADILDIGGYSSRPGARDISEEEELKRIIPPVKNIHARFPDTIISIDTFRSKVAREAAEHGASVINDISGGMLDERMIETAGSLKLPYIVMHMRGNPANMKDLTDYGNLIREMSIFFSERIQLLRTSGICDLIIDPGIGFAKTVNQNFEILKKLTYFQIFGFPLMIGISRKSLIYRTLKTGPGNAMNGSTVLNTIALLNQASILRVHDVKAAREAVILMNAVSW